jgi:hypothetical protein
VWQYHEGVLSLRDVIKALDANTPLVMACFLGIFLLSVFVAFAGAKVDLSKSPLRWVAAGCIYAAGLPGALSAALVLYTLFFRNDGLLYVSIGVYVVPFVCMLACHIVMSRKLDLRQVPGFDRMEGLAIVLIIGFFGALVLHNTRFIIWFGGGFVDFLIIAAVIILILHVATRRMFGEPRRRVRYEDPT